MTLRLAVLRLGRYARGWSLQARWVQGRSEFTPEAVANTAEAVSSNGSGSGSSQRGSYAFIRNYIVNIGSVEIHFTRKADQKEVILIPMHHIASQAFFDDVLLALQSEAVGAILVEGMLENREALQRELEELQLLHNNPTLAGQIADRLVQGTHYSKERVLEEFASYGISEALAAHMQQQLGFRTQELYWKGLLKCFVPQKVFPADIFVSEVTMMCNSHRTEQHVLREGRVEHALAKLRQLAPHYQTFVLPWGFHHMEQFSMGLVQLGFTPSRAMAAAAAAGTQPHQGTSSLKASVDTTAVPDGPQDAGLQQASKFVEQQHRRRSFGWTADVFDRYLAELAHARKDAANGNRNKNDEEAKEADCPLPQK